MERLRGRRFGVKAAVCALAIGSTCVGSAPRASADSTTAANANAKTEITTADAVLPAVIELAETRELPGVVIFPAHAAGARPITVLLHGMCGDAARACSHFADEVTQTANLVCPRARQRCSGGGVSWPDKGVTDAVESAVMRAKAALPAVDETRGRTLIGYSMGAYRALGMAQGSASAGGGANAGKYPRVMLIGAKVALDPSRLSDNGVRRLLLCAGDWDMMHDAMQRETERVRRSGFQARFLGLGPVGHSFAPSFASYLPQALAWLDDA